jgi:L-histidine N-alpha-methyltransferase
MDLVKRTEVLEAAYNDSQGVTARFNKNILRVVNRELGADFDPDHFDHVAFYNDKLDQIEMHLKTKRSLSVGIRKLQTSVRITEGETIHTEISRKFTRNSAERMLRGAGLKIAQWYTDPKGWFAHAEVVGA